MAVSLVFFPRPVRVVSSLVGNATTLTQNLSSITFTGTGVTAVATGNSVTISIASGSGSGCLCRPASGSGLLSSSSVRMVCSGLNGGSCKK